MLSLSGSPPASSFQFHEPTSMLSLEPPPVKIVLLPEPSTTKALATALPPPAVFQSSPGTAGSSSASPSSSNVLSGMARIGAPSHARAPTHTQTPTTRINFPLPIGVSFLLRGEQRQPVRSGHTATEQRSVVSRSTR